MTRDETAAEFKQCETSFVSNIRCCQLSVPRWKLPPATCVQMLVCMTVMSLDLLLTLVLLANVNIVVHVVDSARSRTI